MNASFSESRSREVTPMIMLCTPIARSSFVTYHIIVIQEPMRIGRDYMNTCDIDNFFLNYYYVER